MPRMLPGLPPPRALMRQASWPTAPAAAVAGILRRGRRAPAAVCRRLGTVDQHGARLGAGLAAGRIGAGPGHGDVIAGATVAVGRQFLARHAALDWRGLAVGTFKATVATAALATVVVIVCPVAPAGAVATVAARLALATVAGGLTFCAVLWALDSDELAMLWPRASRRKAASSVSASERVAGTETDVEPPTSAGPHRTPERRGAAQVSSLAP